MENRYASLLEPEERILWQGRPGRVPLFYRVHWLHLPLLAFAAVFALVLAGVFLSGFPRWWPAALLVLPLLLLVLYYGAGQYIQLHGQLKKTEYLITTHRVVRLQNGKTEAHLFGALPPVYMLLRPDGSGTIILSADYLGHEHHRDSSLLRVLPLQKQFRLDCIQEASRVWALIHDNELRHIQTKEE